jgi:hypothetical protein
MEQKGGHCKKEKRKNWKVAVITDKVTEERLQWYVHVERSNEFINVAKDMKVTGGQIL